MRVKCINDQWKAVPGAEEAPRPVFLNDYTVVETKVLGFVETYILAELGDGYGYKTSHFATLPDLTADEMEEEQFIYEPFSC